MKIQNNTPHSKRVTSKTNIFQKKCNGSKNKKHYAIPFWRKNRITKRKRKGGILIPNHLLQRERRFMKME